MQVSWNAGQGDKLELCKLNSQPEVLTGLEVKVSHQSYPSLAATIRQTYVKKYFSFTELFLQLIYFLFIKIVCCPNVSFGRLSSGT